MTTDWNVRREVAEFSRRTYEKGFVAATDGNLSHRISRDRVLVTPSGFCLGEIKPDDLSVVSLDGRTITGAHTPTSEVPMHLGVYRQRPDVRAVVHAHLPITNAFSFAGQVLDPCVIPEVVVSLGRVPTAEYSTPSCDEGPRVIRELIREHDAIILQRHGTLTVGASMREAYFRTEKLEHAAEVLFIARQLGPIRPMNADELRRLAEVCERRGWRPREFVYRACGGLV